MQLYRAGTLMGSITAVPAVMRVHTEEIKMVEINFLCVHKKLRYEYSILNLDIDIVQYVS